MTGFVSRHAWSLTRGDTIRDGRVVAATRLVEPLETETQHRIWIELTDGTGFSTLANERIDATPASTMPVHSPLLTDLDEWHADMEESPHEQM